MIIPFSSLPILVQNLAGLTGFSDTLLLRMGIDLLTVTLLVRLIYYRIYRKTDLFLTFFAFNLVIFLITYLLNQVQLSIGAAFGLFAVFSMLRYRTEGLSAKDMTYLFVVIAIGLIAAVHRGSETQLLSINVVILGCIYLLESSWLIRREWNKTVQYDRLDLLAPALRDNLLHDLRLRTGLPVHRIDIQELDLLKDAARITIYYYNDAKPIKKISQPKYRLIHSLLLGLFMLPSISIAQMGSLGLWTGADADVQLSKKLEINAKGQVRFSDNIQVTRAFLGEAGLTYKFTKAVSVSGYYRYTGRLKKNSEGTGYYYRPYHRFYAEAMVKHKLTNWLKFNYRLRYQNQFMDDNTATVSDKSYLRNKVEFSYSNPSRFTPFVSADLFYRIDQTDGTAGFDQIRYKAGTNVQFNKMHSLDLFFFLDTPLGTSTEPTEPIIGATYKIDLKLNKRKSKSQK